MVEDLGSMFWTRDFTLFQGLGVTY